ncbi:MAG: hypothetical protein CMN30_32995 [Sandaracinus sp.]|nr:hypothetical protein [Sandaracinus sp.]
MSDSEALERIVAALESADAALAKALDERARATLQLRQLQEANPDGYYRIPREEDVIARARERLHDFPPAAIEPVFREVLSGCRLLIAPRIVAYQGAAGGFGHLAARRRFGSTTEFRGFQTVPEVLEEVARGRADHGVLPLETSSDGAITATLHGLASSDVRIGGEVTVHTNYHLLSGTGHATDVDKVYGSRAALAACERFLQSDLPRATVIDVPSGQVAAELAREDHGAAVVGTAMLRELHGLTIARERVEDAAGRETRYAVVGSELPSRTGRDRTVIAMAVGDAPGALYDSLKPFADRDINLTRLESRPTQGAAWRYLFFVEMDGHVTDRPLLTAMDELRNVSRHVKVLGSYPRPAAAAEDHR